MNCLHFLDIYILKMIVEPAECFATGLKYCIIFTCQVPCRLIEKRSAGYAKSSSMSSGYIRYLIDLACLQKQKKRNCLDWFLPQYKMVHFSNVCYFIRCQYRTIDRILFSQVI